MHNHSKIPLNAECFWSVVPLVNKKIMDKFLIHPGILLGRALWADSVSLWINTIVSHNQFKLIRIGENLVVMKYHQRLNTILNFSIKVHKIAGFRIYSI